jgi:hypothetical protein
MASIANVAISALSPNPHRDIGTYPFVERKVESLVRSIEDIGMWESVIARPHDAGYQLAFGHHRVEAAKRCGIEVIPIIVKDLTDEEMLQYMGRENGEDYSTDFLVMLNTWEGAVKFARRAGHEVRPIDVARVLGWVTYRNDRGRDEMSEVAATCSSAHDLIDGNYIKREDLRDLSVKSAREIVARSSARIAEIDKLAKVTQRPAEEVKAAKELVGKAAVTTAGKVRDGSVAQRDLRSQVDVEAMRHARQDKVKPSPLFAVFAKGLSDSLEKMLQHDAAADRLTEIANAVGMVTMDEDREVLRRVDFNLGEVAARAVKWQKKLIPAEKKIVSLKGGA